MPDRYGKYSYFDTPDGEDIPKKCWYVSKNVGRIAVATASLETLFGRGPRTPIAVLAIFAKHIGIAVSTGLAFCSGTYISQDLRQKDDAKNHVVGAAAASCVFGAAVGSPAKFWTTFAVLPLLAYCNKNAYMSGDRLWDRTNLMKMRTETATMDLHIFEADRWRKRSPSLKEMYDEKNEEFWRKQRASKSSSDSQV